MAASAVVAPAIARTATIAATSFFERYTRVLPFSMSVDGVDADDGDAEVAEAVEQSVELCLVGERAGERGLACASGKREMPERRSERLAQAAADDDPVAARLSGFVH